MQLLQLLQLLQRYLLPRQVPRHHLVPLLRLLPLLLQALQDHTVDTDPNDIYNLDITKDGLALIYRSVCFHLEKWPGGHPGEQEALVQLKDNLFRIILEKTLES